MKYNVTDIEFDFDDGNDGESYSLTYDEQIEIRDLLFQDYMNLNTVLWVLQYNHFCWLLEYCLYRKLK